MPLGTVSRVKSTFGNTFKKSNNEIINTTSSEKNYNDKLPQPISTHYTNFIDNLEIQ